MYYYVKKNRQGNIIDIFETFDLLDENILKDYELMEDCEEIQKYYKQEEDKIHFYNSTTELSNNDYKIIKCMETFLSNLSTEEKNILPYNIDELHTTRQALRDIINSINL